MRKTSSTSSGRRDFLKFSAMIFFAGLPINSYAALHPGRPHEKHIELYNIHTREALKTCYYKNGSYLTGALSQVSHIMRDHRTKDAIPIDPPLLDLLYAITVRTGARRPISIISGYRSPSTNRFLRRTTAGVAKNSLHMEGKAVDIRIPGIKTKQLCKLAVRLEKGGVGYYPQSDFMHIDTGPVKAWRF